MKTWTYALLLCMAPVLSGCGQKALPPATETPKVDEAQMQKGIEFMKKMGGHDKKGKKRP